MTLEPVFQPQRGGMFIDIEQQKLSSSVRSGMGTGYAAPMGLFAFSGCYYKHLAPDGAGAAAVKFLFLFLRFLCFLL